jgi:hypothetical protein
LGSVGEWKGSSAGPGCVYQGHTRQPDVPICTAQSRVLTAIGSGTDLALDAAPFSSLRALCTLCSTGPKPSSPDMRLFFKYFSPYPSSTAAVKLRLSGLPIMTFLLNRPPVAGELYTLGLVDTSPSTRRFGVACIVFGGASGLVAIAFSSFDPRKYGVFMIAGSRSSWACPRLDSFAWCRVQGCDWQRGVIEETTAVVFQSSRMYYLASMCYRSGRIIREIGQE